MHEVTLIPGEGIGPEVIAAARRVIDSSGVQIKWQVMEAGGHVADTPDAILPDYVLDSLVRTRFGLKGPIATPIAAVEFQVVTSWTNGGKNASTPRSYPSVNVALRKELDLYANLRPARVYPGIHTRFENVDLVVVRENTEDLYVGVEHMITPDIAEAIKVLSRRGSERIVKFAFDYAVRLGRKKVTAVHKANILKRTDGLFLESARAIARGYPQIQFEDRIIDNMCMQLVQFPEAYDVIVAPNLYGDILSDLTAGLVGGLGVAPGANLGEEVKVFEPVHGTAPTIAGQDKANPMAAILSGVMMLGEMGELEAARRIDSALTTVLKEGEHVTADLGGHAGTREMTDAILKAMEGR